MPKEIKRLQDAIRATHGCESKYIASKVITESFEGKTAWKGVVAIFNLIDHPKAKRAYAWTYRDGDQDKTVAVLGVPPVDAPEKAVKVAIASKARK
jgi:hypothetical protein